MTRTPSTRRHGTATLAASLPLAPLLFAALLLAALLLAAAPARAEPLGKLFFTPERRAALDRLRELNLQENAPVVEDETLRVDGIIRRSSGRVTTWVNGQPRDEQATGGGIRVEVNRADPTRAQVSGEDESGPSLKVGDTYSRTTGETRSVLGEGHITVKPAGKK